MINHLQKFKDYRESRRIKNEIKGIFLNLYYSDYDSLEEALPLFTRAYELINNADEFNKKTTSKHIDTKELTGSLLALEMRVDMIGFPA